jgi:hypothetical protein
MGIIVVITEFEQVICPNTMNERRTKKTSRLYHVPPFRLTTWAVTMLQPGWNGFQSALVVFPTPLTSSKTGFAIISCD